MQLKSIEFRNIFSYGNNIKEINLSDEGALYQIVGKNGYGKSSIISLPKLLFYGKLDKLKKEDIANRINHNAWIKGVIQINPSTEIIIERTFSPSSLIVYKRINDGEMLDIGKSGINNYQEFIDTEVTSLPYHIFSNIVSLSVNDFKSFLQMSPYDKRIIIDKLFA